MGVIVKEIEIIGDKGKDRVKALFDSGASDSLIRKDIAEKIATLLKRSRPLKFILGDGKSKLISRYTTILEMIINGVRIPMQLFGVVNMKEEVIIGADAFQRWKFKLDFEKEDVIIDKDALQLRLV